MRNHLLAATLAAFVCAATAHAQSQEPVKKEGVWSKIKASGKITVNGKPIGSRSREGNTEATKASGAHTRTVQRPCSSNERPIFACTLEGETLAKPALVQVCQGPDAMSFSFDLGGPNQFTLTGDNETVREYTESNASGNNNTFFFFDKATSNWHVVEHMADWENVRLLQAYVFVRNKASETSETDYYCKDESVRFDRKAITATPNAGRSIKRFDRGNN